MPMHSGGMAVTDNTMDIYEYNEDNLSTVAGSCRYLSCKQHHRSGTGSAGISCSICNNWNGRNCNRKQFDSIASELDID